MPECLILGARDFVSKVGCPADLLNFLHEAIVLVHHGTGRLFDEKEGHVFEVTLLIEQIVQPWFAFAIAVADGDICRNLFYDLAEGFISIHDYAGAEGYFNLMGAITTAIGDDFKTGRCHEPYQKKKMEILNALIFLVYPLEEYENLREKEREQSS